MCGRRVTHSDPLAAIHQCHARESGSGPRGDRRARLLPASPGAAGDLRAQRQHPGSEQGGAGT